MRLAIIATLCLAPVGAAAQLLFFDQFDSRTPGNLGGQGGWIEAEGTTRVATAGGINPAAFSGSQMASQQPTTRTAAILAATPFAGRTPGNDLLVIEGRLHVPSSVIGLSTMFVGATGLLGGAPTFMGYAGITGSGFFFGAEGSVILRRARIPSTWQHLRVEIDTVAHSVTGYANGSLMGSTSYNSNIVLNNWGIHSSGRSTGPVFFDDFRVSAAAPVPEPFTLGFAGLALVAAARRRRR